MLQKSGATEAPAEAAYRRMRNRILHGEFGVGKALSRRSVARDLGIGIGRVSEAFLRLEMEGLIESRPRAGTRVRVPSRQDIEGHYMVREALEAQAVRLFAKAATDAEVIELQKLAEKLDDLAANPQTRHEEYLALHEKLHHRIAECARCPALTDAIDKIFALASPWLSLGARTGALPIKRHQMLIAALAGRNPEVAAEAMRRHIIVSKHKTLNRLEMYFESE